MVLQLGFMAPDGTTNLGLKDTINAMKFVQTIAPFFGGSASKITVAGQSSGANMIRALLATPSAADLFASAILQSDPMVCTSHSPLLPISFSSELWLLVDIWPGNATELLQLGDQLL